MKTIYKLTCGSVITIIIGIVLYFSFESNAKDLNTFLLVGDKFSDWQSEFSDSYVKTNTAGDRITYSFLNDKNNLTQFAVKDDIIEVVEVYNVFTDEGDALELYTDLSIHMVTKEKCHLLRAYNSTIEFEKANVIVRIEQIPTIYGQMIKFTSYLKEME